MVRQGINSRVWMPRCLLRRRMGPAGAGCPPLRPCGLIMPTVAGRTSAGPFFVRRRPPGSCGARRCGAIEPPAAAATKSAIESWIPWGVLGIATGTPFL